MIAYFGSDTPSREVRKEPLKGDMIKTNGLIIMKHREQSSVVNTVEIDVDFYKKKCPFEEGEYIYIQFCSKTSRKKYDQTEKKHHK